MRRFRKLLGMIFIFGMVFFIIADEKGYKIGFENNQIVFNKIEKKSDLNEIQFDPNAVYKNSSLININYEFENPRKLRKSNGVDRKYIAKLEKEKELEEERLKAQEKSRNKIFDDDTILSAFQGGTGTTETVIEQNTGTKRRETKQNTGTIKQETKQNTGTTKQDAKQKTGTTKADTNGNTGKSTESKNKSGLTTKFEVPTPAIVFYPVKKYEHSNHTVNLNKGVKIPKVKIEKYERENEVVMNLRKGKEPGPLYKNSHRIKIYSGFENPIALRNSAGIDEEFILRQKNNKPTIISLDDSNTISSALQNNSKNKDKEIDQRYNEQDEINPDFSENEKMLNINTGNKDSDLNISDIIETSRSGNEKEKIKNKNLEELKAPDSQQDIETIGVGFETGKNESVSQREKKYKVEKYELESHSIDLSKGEESEKTLVKVDKYELKSHEVNLKDGISIESNNFENNLDKQEVEEEKYTEDKNIETNEKEIYATIEKPKFISHSIDLSKGEESEKTLVKVDKYELKSHEVNLKDGLVTEISEVNGTEDGLDKQEKEKSEYSEDENIETTEKENYVTIEKPKFIPHSIDLSKGEEPEIILVKVERYLLNKHAADLKKGKITEYDFIVENTEPIEQNENGLSNAMLDSLLGNEEIDINTLESENDEFLQKVFEKTSDRDVMNLIIENYLNEYQFAKAKIFIENLPDMYREDIKPSLNLRVAFNSFSLSSKNINENLTTILENYASKNEISNEDKNRYSGIVTLMDRNYDHFFEIATGFTSEKNVSFATKLQGYKDQISKQMGMPDYYFDTLVSLELFNQGLFQPAKVLALYSLQQNSNYILPYQVLAYANFLTNSRDTSIEYLKKLVDLDPNNTEKYHFLMGVAFYRDEKYEQSVVMLSMIKDESLRLDTQRYLINNYIKLDQKNKLISSRNKMLGYENLVASDFYTYFYETFFHPYSEGGEFQLYAYDTELANKMLRVCSITLQNEEKAVCTYGTIGRNIAMGQFDGLEQYLLNLATEYPQGYLYQALGDYYIQQGDLEKAKIYLIKAISLTQKKSERSQIKKLLQDTI